MKVCSSDAGVTHSDKDVMHEPTGLVRGQENKRPGDVVLILNRNYSDPHRLSRWIIAALDVTTCNAAPLTSPSDCQRYESLRSLQRAEKRKMNGPPRQKHEKHDVVHGRQLIKQLLDDNILVMPFAVDVFGRLSPFAKKLLYDKDSRPTDYCQNKLKSIEQEIQDSNFSKDAPRAILDRASRHWARCHPGKPFGRTYADKTPKQWAANNFAIDCIRSTMRHINGHMLRDQCPSVTQSKSLPFIPALQNRPSHAMVTIPTYFEDNQTYFPDGLLRPSAQSVPV